MPSPGPSKGRRPAAEAESHVVRGSSWRRECDGRRNLRRSAAPRLDRPDGGPRHDSKDVSPGWQPSWMPRPERSSEADDLERWKDPAAFREPNVEQVGRSVVDRGLCIGVSTQGLVEHDGHTQARTKLGKSPDLGMRNGLFEGRWTERKQRRHAIDELGRRPRLVRVEPDIHATSEYRSHPSQPATIVLALGTHFDFHLMETVNPHLQGRDALGAGSIRP